MRILAILPLLLLILAACEEGPSQYERDEDRHARLNPPGRYQMNPAPDGLVYVLDTGDGSIRICGPIGEPNAQQAMGCGPAARQ